LTNTNFGTVASYLSGSDKLPGIVFTPTRIGDYFVCAVSASSSSGAGSDLQHQLVDGSGTVVGMSSAAVGSANNVIPFTICGKYSASSLSAVTLKIQSAYSSGTGSVSATGALATAITWSIFTLN
jgi:hypothetical protein